MKKILSARVKPAKPQKHIEGFTLAELMITIVVLAIVLSIAVPSMQTLLRKQELKSATDLMISTLAHARNEAVSRVKSVTLCGSTNGTSCNNSSELSLGWLVFVDYDNNHTFSNGDELLKFGNLVGAAATSVKLTANAKYITYSSKGESDARAIAICNSDAGSDNTKSRTITVTIAGGSRISLGASCPATTP